VQPPRGVTAPPNVLAVSHGERAKGFGRSRERFVPGAHGNTGDESVRFQVVCCG
jgi:hypothetical protein